jgi:hypothetical protein
MVVDWVPDLSLGHADLVGLLLVIVMRRVFRGISQLNYLRFRRSFHSRGHRRGRGGDVGCIEPLNGLLLPSQTSEIPKITTPYLCCSRYYPASIDYVVRGLTRDRVSGINGGDKHQHTAKGSSLMALDCEALGGFCVLHLYQCNCLAAR